MNCIMCDNHTSWAVPTQVTAYNHAQCKKLLVQLRETVFCMEYVRPVYIKERDCKCFTHNQSNYEMFNADTLEKVRLRNISNLEKLIQDYERSLYDKDRECDIT